jgi:inorganic triphosphatase YgiF
MAVRLRFEVAAEDLPRLARIEFLRRSAWGHPRISRLYSLQFDTADLALRDRGIALGLRRVSGASAQTLSEERLGASGARTYQWPVRGRALDLSLVSTTPLGKFFAKKRIRSGLTAIFSTRLRRKAWLLKLDGATAVELYLDSGEIAAGTRRERIGELNIELIKGDPSRAYDLALELTDAIALRLEPRSLMERGYRLYLGKPEPPRRAVRPALSPSMTPVEALQRIAATCIGQIHANEAGFLQGEDPEYLHQLRVGWRRLRSALSMARDPGWKEALEPLRPDLRWLSRSLNTARNWDVFAIEILPSVLRGLSRKADPSRSRELTALRRRCNRMRERYGGTARDAVRSERYQRLLLKLGRLLAAPAVSPPAENLGGTQHSVRDLAAAALQRRDRKLRKLGRHVVTASAGDRHQVRIEAKKLRYTSEFFVSLFSRKRAKRYAARLADLQEVLGAANDAVNSAEMIAEAAHSGRAPLHGNAVELAAAWLAAVEAEQLSRLRKSWARLSRQKPFWRGA